MRKRRYCIFTDLDGTLLESSVIPKKVIPFVNSLKERGIPIIFCSVRTFEEQLYFRKQLNIHDPFIIENGSAIYVPQNYFPFDFNYSKQEGNHKIIEFGKNYEEIKKILSSISQQIGIDIKGFGEMNVNEIAKRMGISVELARKAKERRYSEVIASWKPEEKLALFLEKVEKEKLNWIYGGRFYTISSNEKGDAVLFLSSLYKKMGDVITVGIGNSENDLSLLESVDIPFLVQQPTKKWAFHRKNIHMVNGIGAKGWIEVVKNILSSSEGLQ